MRAAGWIAWWYGQPVGAGRSPEDAIRAALDLATISVRVTPETAEEFEDIQRYIPDYLDRNDYIWLLSRALHKEDPSTGADLDPPRFVSVADATADEIQEARAAYLGKGGYRYPPVWMHDPRQMRLALEAAAC